MRPELHVRQARRQQARDSLRAQASRALTKIAPALPRECAPRQRQAKFGPAVHRDRVAHLVPAALHRDFHPGQEAEDVPETNPLAASGPGPQAEFRKLSLESPCMHVSLPRRAGGRQSKSDMRKVSAGFTQCEHAPEWAQAAPRT